MLAPFAMIFVIKEENKAMKAAKEKGEVYKAEELENGDTLRHFYLVGYR